jgi:hypothetical protein
VIVVVLPGLRSFARLGELLSRCGEQLFERPSHFDE